MICASPIKAGPRCADLALVLAVDSSSSVDEDEFRLQVLGYASAFTDPKVVQALNAAGTVDVSSVFWADSAFPLVVTEWMRISGEADVAAVAESFLLIQRRSFGDTDLGDGVMAALDLFEVPGKCSARKVVNVSGDGRASLSNRGAAYVSVAEARARAEAMGVTVNGLAIVNDEPALGDYYHAELITGPGSFVMETQDFRAFGEAIVQKLEREIRPQLSASLDAVAAEGRVPR
jgi:hypothetical protein